MGLLLTCGGPQRPSETHHGSLRDRAGVSTLYHSRTCLLADTGFGIFLIKRNGAK